MKLHTALSALGILAVLVAPAFAQIPPPFSYDFEEESSCGTSTTTVCPLVGPTIYAPNIFVNLTDDGQDWLPDTNGTGSSGTGPSTDFNPGTSTGVYLYVETSGGTNGAEIKLRSPLLDRTGLTVMRVGFWYHMLGATMGTLHLDLVDQINTGTDGAVTMGANTFDSATATFTPADVGHTITISGSASSDGTYVITGYMSPTQVVLDSTFAAPEVGLSYSHERLTTDVTPPFTDNVDLWQQSTAVFCSSSFANTGNSQAFAVIIRAVRGASFTADCAIDEFFFDVPPMINDVGVTSIDSPGSSVIAGTFPVTVTLQNFGTSAQSSIPIELVVDAGTPIPEIFPGPLPPCGTATYTFTAMADLSTLGAHTLNAYTLLPGDANPSNDAASLSVASLALVNTFPYLQDFEMGPGSWVSGGQNDSWALGTPAKTTIIGAASGVNAWVQGGLAGTYNANEQSFISGPIFDFSSLAYPWIQLSVWWESENSWDGAVLQTSIDSGMSWQNVGAFGDPNNWYTDNTINGAPGGSQEGWTGSAALGSGMWVTAQHDMFDLAFQPNVLVRIAFGSDGSVQQEGVAFDDINIYDNGPTWPGTPTADLLLATGVNGPATSFTGNGEEVKTATALDLLNLLVSSPTGIYDFQPFALVAQPFMTGNPNPGGPFPPPIYIDTTQPFVILIGIEAFLTQTIIPGGVGYSASMPFGFAGQSFMFQAVCITPAFAITDGYEIQVQ